MTFRQFKAVLDIFGKIGTFLDIFFGYCLYIVWTFSGQFLTFFAISWSFLDIIGPFWTIFRHPITLKVITQYMDATLHWGSLRADPGLGTSIGWLILIYWHGRKRHTGTNKQTIMNKLQKESLHVINLEKVPVFSNKMTEFLSKYFESWAPYSLLKWTQFLSLFLFAKLPNIFLGKWETQWTFWRLSPCKI